MYLLLWNLLYASGGDVISLYSWLISTLLLSGFIVLIKQVYAPDNRARYQQESQIPLDDDTLEETQRLNHQRRYQAHHTHIDA